MKYRIYIVNADDIDRFDTSFQEVKEQAEDFISDENLERLFISYLKRNNEGTIDNTNSFHFLCDEDNEIILEH